jgi:hypothetical protein
MRHRRLHTSTLRPHHALRLENCESSFTVLGSFMCFCTASAPIRYKFRSCSCGGKSQEDENCQHQPHCEIEAVFNYPLDVLFVLMGLLTVTIVEQMVFNLYPEEGFGPQPRMP